MKNLYLLIACCLFAVGYGQNPTDIDLDFNASGLPANYYNDYNYLNNYNPKKMELQSDGKVLTNSGNGLERIIGNIKDLTFNTGTGFQNDTPPEFYASGSFPSVNAFKQLSNGKIIVGGDFTSYDGHPVKNIIMLNPDGSIDPTFNSGTGFDAVVKTIEVQPDGKIVVSGDFTYYDGSPYNKLIRLNSDGAIDLSFAIGTGLNNPFEDIAIQSDGKIIGCGNFAFYNGSGGPYGLQLIRLNANGTIDNTFNLGVVGNVVKVVVLPDGKILTGGDGLHKLNQDGTIDTGFVNPNFYGVTDLGVQNDGKILVSGNLYNGNPNDNTLMKLNAEGTIDTAFNSTLNGNSSESVSSLLLLNDGKILINLGSVFSNDIRKLNNDGTFDNSFNIGDGFSSNVEKIIIQPDGKILAGGTFIAYNGLPTNGLVRLNVDGSIDSGFATGLLNSFSVSTFALQADGKIIVSLRGGFFIGWQTQGLIRLNQDGSIDNTFVIPMGINLWDAKAITIQPDGKILVGGEFLASLANGNVCGIIRLGSNGTPDASFNGGSWTGTTYNTSVNAIVLQPDGKILVGGDFTTFNTSASTPENKYLVRLNSNGTIDTGFFNGGYNFNAGVRAIALQNDNKILAGGIFTAYSGVGLARLNNDGSNDSSFYTNLKFDVSEIVLQPDNKILVGGSFNQINGVRVNKLIRLIDDNLDPDFNTGNGFNDEVRTIAFQDNGKILVGGHFKSYKEFSAKRIVRLKGNDFYEIKGISKLDSNNDGCTASDINFPNLKFDVLKGSVTTTTIANVTGNYSIRPDSGDYTITPILENPNYFTITPTSFSASFPSQASPFVQNLCITANGIHNDLEVTLLPMTAARPGFDAKYKLVYKNKGNQVQSGTVSLAFNDAALEFVSAIPAVSGQATNSLSWSFSSLNPFETREIVFTLNLNSPTETPALNGGSILNYTADITSPADETQNDNNSVLNQTVVNAFDPNNKTCLEGLVVGTDKIGKYVHYIIHFENTGTYAAQNIVISDVIDSNKFDVNSLIPISGSHLFSTKITDGNKVEFKFDNINLPYSTINKDGYVAFKIKTKATLSAGDTFGGNAAIYFDYNSAITTNTYTTTIQALSTQDFSFGNYFSLYPNPVSDVLNMNKKETIEISSIHVYSVLGQLMMVIPNAKNVETIDVSNLPSGNYFVKVNSDKGTSNTKFIKR